MSANNTDLFWAFLGGAALGAGVAVLTTPRSGPELRESIRERFDASRHSVAALPPAMREAYDAASNAARRAFDDAYDKAYREHLAQADSTQH